MQRERDDKERRKTAKESRKCGLEISHFPVESGFGGVSADLLQIPEASNRENIGFHRKSFQIGDLHGICVERKRLDKTSESKQKH